MAAIVDAGAASAPRGRARVLTPDGKSTNRNAERANEAGQGTACSNPADGKAARQHSPDFVAGAGPRPTGRLQLQPGRQRSPPARLAVAGARGSAGFAHAAALCLGCWPDSADWHTNVASAGPLPGKLHCNSVVVDRKAETTVHSLSRDSAGCATAAETLDGPSKNMDTEVGPREVALPKLKPRRKA